MTQPKAATKWTARELKARILARHPLDKGWFSTCELCPASGSSGAAGRMDVAAVCLYRSRDFAVHGFEVKVARSDWLAERNDPSKNAIALEEVDFWWIVAPTPEIVKPEELLPKWGLMLAQGKGLKVAKRAERLKPEGAPFARAFVVSLLWKVAHFKPPAEEEIVKRIALERCEARDAGVEDGKRLAARHAPFERAELENLRTAVAEFEKRAGIGIQSWNGGLIGECVRAVTHIDQGQPLRSRINRARQAAEEFMAVADRALAELAAVSTEPTE